MNKKALFKSIFIAIAFLALVVGGVFLYYAPKIAGIIVMLLYVGVVVGVLAYIMLNPDYHDVG